MQQLKQRESAFPPLLVQFESPGVYGVPTPLGEGGLLGSVL